MKQITFFVALFIATSINISSGQEVLKLQDSLSLASQTFLFKPLEHTYESDTVIYRLYAASLLPDTTLLSNKRLYFRFIPSKDIIEQYNGKTGKTVLRKKYKKDVDFPIRFQDEDKNFDYTEEHFKLERVHGNRLLFKSYRLFTTKISTDSSSFRVVISPYIGFRTAGIYKEGERKLYTDTGSNGSIYESFKLDDKFYKFANLDYHNKTIELHEIPDNEHKTAEGLKEGMTIKDFDKMWKSKLKKAAPTIAAKKYNLFHFWGDWCRPCVKKLPSHVTMFNRIDSSQVNIVNVAYVVLEDNGLGIENTKELIQKHQIPGYHLFDKREGEVVNSMGVLSFPTLMLTDDKGKILYHTDSPENAKDVFHFGLMALLRDNKVLK